MSVTIRITEHNNRAEDEFDHESEENIMADKRNRKRVPFLVWPFWAIWRLIAWIVGLTGRLVAVILGFVFMIAGVLISLTVIGLVVGIPLFIFGLLLVFRGLF